MDMKLYRPTGLNELRLVYQSGMKHWPPRFPEQSIFYPVLERCYAQQIARDWNTKSDTYAGFVAEFEIEDAYINKFEKHIVGSSQHVELWIPAEELKRFNNNIISLNVPLNG